MYTSWYWIDEQIGNNVFSWKERKSLWSELKIYVPSLIIWNFSDLAVWKHIAFEEIKLTTYKNNNNKEKALDSHIWLNHFIKTEREWTPVYVVDNHNHVLWFWYQLWMKYRSPGLLVHIDQHTDMNVPEGVKDGDRSRVDRSRYITETLNVGNFIVPAREAGIIDEVVQINTEYTLNQCLHLNKLNNVKYWKAPKKPIILDIDLDFWAPGMWIEYQDRSFEQVRKLCRQADLITVATSPYFLDQEFAIALVRKIFR